MYFVEKRHFSGSWYWTWYNSSQQAAKRGAQGKELFDTTTATEILPLINFVTILTLSSHQLHHCDHVDGVQDVGKGIKHGVVGTLKKPGEFAQVIK